MYMQLPGDCKPLRRRRRGKGVLRQSWRCWPKSRSFMVKYAAFLRGINIGGRRVKMTALQKAFESLGFTDVKTYIASGNVVFAARVQSGAALRTKIEQKLRTQFGF